MDNDEELAHELLLGISGSKGREFLKPGSERELSARAALARVMRAEAPHGYFTQRVANLIDPPHGSVVSKRKLVFQRPKGTPVVVSERQRAEIAAFMHEQNQKRGTVTDKLSKQVEADAHDKFGYKRSTLRKIWKDFRLRVNSGEGKGRPIK
jgi:hypothetical protein